MKLSHVKHIYILFTIWAIIHGIFLYNHGIITVGEAEKYIYQAHSLLDTGTLTATNFWFYFTQISLLALAFKTGIGYSLVVIVQLIFSAWATMAFYRLAVSLFSKQVAFIGTLLMLVNYPLQEFNTYVQTESLFHSFTIIFSAYLLQLTKFNVKSSIIIILSTVIICITRPTGLLFVPAIALYLFFKFFQFMSIRLKIVIVTFASISFLVLMNAVIGSKGEWDFMLPYLGENIICGVATLNHNADIKTHPNGDSIYGLFYYIVHNFGQFSHMAFLRSKAFFGLLRTYYSTAHNIYLVVLFYPLYVASVWSLKWWLKNNIHHLIYFSFILLMTWGTTLLTCDDWHNRWFLTTSPYLIIAALPAITKLFAILTSYGPKRNIQQ
jgi:hypothetical protein